MSGKQTPLATIYFATACLTLLSVGKMGASENYFLEVIAVSCVLCGLWLRQCFEQTRNDSRIAVTAVSLLAVHAFQAGPSMMFRTPTDEDRILRDRISAEVRRLAPDTIWTEDASLAVVNGAVPVADTFSATQLAKASLWDQSMVLGAFENGQIPLVILDGGMFGRPRTGHRQRMTEEIHHALNAHYRIHRKFQWGRFELRVPKKADAPASLR